MIKKIITRLLVIILLLSSSLTLAAETEPTVGMEKPEMLKELEMIKNYNLKLAEEQLKDQGMMSHYEMHKQLIEDDYNKAKDVLLGKNEVTPMSVDYHMPNGGQIRTETTLGYKYEITEELYIESQLQEIINDWNATHNYTVGGLAELVVFSIASYKIPKIGLTYAGYSIFMYVAHLFEKQKLEDIRDYGYGLNRTLYGEDSGRSSIWLYWTGYPYSPSYSSTTRIISAIWF